MRSVYETYGHLWPEKARESVKKILSSVGVAHFPAVREEIRGINKSKTVAVVKDLKLKELMRLVDMGFSHIVQSERADFAHELLASCFMISRPDIFFKKPIPFFLNGFSSSDAVAHPDKHLILRFAKPSEKETLLDWLGVFLDQDPRTAALGDLCLQVADEMVSNVLFNAPIGKSRKRIFKDLSRTTDLELPTGRRGKLFACFAEHKIVIGCVDSYGSLNGDELTDYLGRMFNEKGSEFRPTGGGAGLGLKYIIENSANFYLQVSPGKFSLMACGFMLKGFQANINPAKNLHFCFA